MYASFSSGSALTPEELLDAARRGERVIITYRDKDYVELVAPAITDLHVENGPVFGMWADYEKTSSVEKFVDQLREPRHHVD